MSEESNARIAEAVRRREAQKDAGNKQGQERADQQLRDLAKTRQTPAQAAQKR